MASAGRILIMPKGEYNSGTTYEMLDLVFYNGTSWLAKKTVVGIEPSEANSEYWFKLCDTVDLSDIERRLTALENEENVDLTPYAKQSELENVENDLANLTTDVDTLETSVASILNTIGGLSSSKVGIAKYTGIGAMNNPDKPTSVTFDFVPKVIIMLGWYFNPNNTSFSPSQTDIENGGYKFNQKVIFCDLLTTEYVSGAGFLYNDSSSQPTRYAKKSADGKTIYWYATGSAYTQCNSTENEYYVLGIG